MSSFNQPRYVCVTPDCQYVISDSANHCVRRFDSAGNYLGHFGGYGRGDGQIKFPYGVEVNRCETPPTIEECNGPPIAREEVSNAIRQTKGGKAPGEDKISAEMWKALGDFGIDKLTQLFNNMYDTGAIPDDLVKSIFIPLPKKPKATMCGDYRLISLMPHITKIFLRVVLNRIKTKIDIEVDEAQFGFRPGRGTREGIFCFNILAQKHIEVKREMYVCFIDYAKAFDRVKHENLIQCLQEIGLDGKDIRIIANLYWHQQAAMRVENDISEYTPIQRGVRQGCILSPILFNIYTELISDNLKISKVQALEVTTLVIYALLMTQYLSQIQKRDSKGWSPKQA